MHYITTIYKYVYKYSKEKNKCASVVNTTNYMRTHDLAYNYGTSFSICHRF